MTLRDEDIVTTRHSMTTTPADADGTDTLGSDADGSDTSGSDADGTDTSDADGSDR